MAWSLAAIFLWYFGGKELGAVFGLQFPDEDADPVIGLGHFATDDFIWFYIYYSVFTMIFCGFWANYASQVAVMVNTWFLLILFLLIFKYRLLLRSITGTGHSMMRYKMRCQMNLQLLQVTCTDICSAF